MPKKTAAKKEKGLAFPHFKHHLIPSAAGGIAAYALTGAVLLGLGVFASVWVANMINHKLHKKA